MQKIINKTIRVIGIADQILMPDSEITVSDAVAELDSIRVFKDLGMIEVKPVVEEAQVKAEEPAKVEVQEEEKEAEEPAQEAPKTVRKSRKKA